MIQCLKNTDAMPNQLNYQFHTTMKVSNCDTCNQAKPTVFEYDIRSYLC